jgi:hypothetical protein
LGKKALRVVARWGSYDVRPGLTSHEFAEIENEFGFEFSDDHRAFLVAGLPVAPSLTRPGIVTLWPDWRDGDREALRSLLDGPATRLLFNVAHDRFWYDGWGTRPTDKSEALTIARERLRDVPTLVPIYRHHFLPAGHGTSGHPVLSMNDTIVLREGDDLLDYMLTEFAAPRGNPLRSRSRPTTPIPFWQDLMF